MADKKKQIKTIAVYINRRNKDENSVYYRLDNADYFVPVEKMVSEIAKEKSVVSLSTSPNVVSMIHYGDARHVFYVDNEAVTDEVAIEVAHNNIGEYKVER